MRRIALVVLAAACSGGSPQKPAPHSAATAVAGSVDEDWRPRLQAMIGRWTFTPAAGQPGTETCRWIPNGTFIVCVGEGQPVTKLFGWEPNNRRYVLWAVDNTSGEVTVVPGSITNQAWTFEGAGIQVVQQHDSPTKWTVTTRTDTGTVLQQGTLATETAPPAPSPTPAPKTSTDDWHSALQPFVGEWSFEGTAHGQPLTFRESCRWITGGTFVACHVDGSKELALFGWEPTNARYVHVAIDDKGQPQVSVGTQVEHGWTFAAETMRFTLERESALKMTIVVEEQSPRGGWTQQVSGTLSTQIE